MCAEEYAVVADLLKRAEALTENNSAERAVTYNNFACFSRQQGRLHASLSYLQKALAIENRLPDVPNRADTHLNLCAVLSQLSRHPEALEHAQEALTLLQEELFGSGSGHISAAQKPDRVAVLAICYHNIGVECEFLKLHQACTQAYTKGVEIATVYLGAEHGITTTLQKSLNAAKVSIERATKRATAGSPRPAGAKVYTFEASERTARVEAARRARSRSPRAGAGSKPRAEPDPDAPDHSLRAMYRSTPLKAAANVVLRE